jgi:hypothetical protein
MPVKMSRVGKKGFSLALTVIVTFLLLMIVTSLVLQLTYRSRATLVNFNSLTAFNLARSGIAKAAFELQKDPLWGSSGAYILTEDNGTCDISVTVPSGSPSPVKNWKVTATGHARGNTRAITAWLEKRSSLDYLSWSDSEHSSYGEAWLSSNETFTGPMHTNGFFSFRGKPRFTAPLASANLNDPCFKSQEGLYSQGGKSYGDNRLFYHYYTSYTNDMPSPLSSNTSFAFQGAANPSAFPVFDPTWRDRATLVFDGDVDIIQFSSNGTVSIRQDRVTKTYAATTIIYVKGAVSSLNGTLKGSATVIAEKDISITARTIYGDKTRDSLALISGGNINLDTGTRKNIRIDGYLASLGGTFLVKDYDKGKPRGSIILFGGIMQKYASPANTFTPGTYELESGFLRSFTYDTRCQSMPSWFPQAGYLRICAFKDENAPAW